MKIICLADAFDAMTSDRPYRPALELGSALGRIGTSVSVQFDPEVTRAFLHVLRAEVRGEETSTQILSGIDLRFSHAAVLGRIDHLLGELGPVHG
jgi:HD-GYP domain-containing protein (c-di-GMP phosphodiesterase class II)